VRSLSCHSLSPFLKMMKLVILLLGLALCSANIPPSYPGPSPSPTLQQILDGCLSDVAEQVVQNAQLQILQTDCFEERDTCKDVYHEAQATLEETTQLLLRCTSLYEQECSGQKRVPNMPPSPAIEEPVYTRLSTKSQADSSDLEDSLDRCNERLRKLKQVKGGLNQTTIECWENVDHLNKLTTYVGLQTEATQTALDECREDYFQCTGTYPDTTPSPSPSFLSTPSPSSSPTPGGGGVCPTLPTGIIFETREAVFPTETYSFASGTCGDFLLPFGVGTHNTCLGMIEGEGTFSGMTDIQDVGTTFDMCLDGVDPVDFVFYVGCFFPFGGPANCQRLTFTVSSL